MGDPRGRLRRALTPSWESRLQKGLQALTASWGPPTQRPALCPPVGWPPCKCTSGKPKASGSRSQVGPWKLFLHLQNGRGGGEGSCMRVILDDSVVPAGRAELQGDIKVPSPRGSAGECPASGGGPAFAEPCGVGRPCQGRGRGPWRSPWPQAPWAPGTCCGPEPHPQNWFSGGQGGTETEHAVPRNANDPAQEKGSAQPQPGAGSRCPCLGWRGKPLLRSARRGFVSGRGERGPPG